MTSVARGVLVRLCDKFARIANLIEKAGEVKDESVLDTIHDAVNYLIILKAVLSDEKKKIVDKKRKSR